MIFGELHISNPAFYVYNISIFIKINECSKRAVFSTEKVA